MPNVQHDPKKTIRCGLKTAPPDGFVVLRKLSYGESLTLQEISAQMRAARNAESNGRARTDMMVDYKATASTAFGFSHSILDHNLQKSDGTPINFHNPAEISLLEPEVGQELEDLVNKLNAGEDMAPFVLSANSPSKQDQDGQSKNHTLVS